MKEKEYITKAQVIEAIEKAVAPVITTIGDYETIGVFTRKSIEQIVSNIPAADIAEVRHGRWVEDGFQGIKCSMCDKRPTLLVKTHYCPNCGALMKEDEHEVSE